MPPSTTSTPTKEDTHLRPMVVGLLNLVDLFRLSAHREFLDHKESTPTDWEGNFGWLIDAVTVSEFFVEKTFPQRVAYHSKIASVVGNVLSASTVLEKRSDTPAEDRMKAARARIDEALGILEQWQTELGGDGVRFDLGDIHGFTKEIRDIAQEKMFSGSHLEKTADAIEATVEKRVGEIVSLENPKDGSDSTVKRGEKIVDLQKLSCMGLREYSLAAPVRIYFGESAKGRELVESVKTLHEKVVKKIPDFAMIELKNSIESRIRFCAELLDAGDPADALFDRGKISEMVERYLNVETAGSRK